MWRDKESIEAGEILQDDFRENLMENIRMAGDLSDEQLRDYIHECVLARGGSKGLSLREKEQIAGDIFNRIRRLGILQELLDDEDVSEIMVNGHRNVFVERNGVISRWEKRFFSEDELMQIIQRIVAGTNRQVNESRPIVDTRLASGDRVNIVTAPAALNGPVMTIRRFPKHPFTMKDLIARGTLSPEVAEYLGCLVRSGYNIFISGGTGSGKTTFLNVLAREIPPGERVITIEDSAELQLVEVENLVRLETREANAEGNREISIRDLIRTALRMRPDRIVVGEVRGPEALDMLQAMNTGHDGSLSTGHANSCRDMLARLETMVLTGAADLPMEAVRRQIASGIDVMVHLGRLRDRTRKVLSVEEIAGMENGEILTRELFSFCEEGEVNGRIYGTWQKKGDIKDTSKLAFSGWHLPA